jgi:hypothetical protein
VKCEKIEDKNSGNLCNIFLFIVTLFRFIFKSVITFLQALRELKQLAIKQFAIPGESGWPLGTLYPTPSNRNEGGV